MECRYTSKNITKALSTKAYGDLTLNKNEVCGQLRFASHYETNEGFYEFSSHPDRLIDRYAIKIDLKNLMVPKRLGLPSVFEVSNKLQGFAQQHSKLLAEDLHVYANDKSCCLGLYTPYDPPKTFEAFMTDVLAYFYWHTYYNQHGDAPWEGLPHGVAGITMKYKESKRKLSELKQTNRVLLSQPVPRRNDICHCGKKKYKKCHLSSDDEIKHRLLSLQNEMEYLKNKIDG